MPLTINPITGKPDIIGLTTISADARYLMLDQSIPQTIINGSPIFGEGLTVSDNKFVLFGSSGFLGSNLAFNPDAVSLGLNNNHDFNIILNGGRTNFYKTVSNSPFIFIDGPTESITINGQSLFNENLDIAFGKSIRLSGHTNDVIIGINQYGFANPNTLAFLVNGDFAFYPTVVNGKIAFYDRDLTRIGYFDAQNKRLIVDSKLIIGSTLSSSYRLDVKGTSLTDSINSDIGLNLSQVARPSSFTARLAGAGAGNVNNGLHYYYISYVTAVGETQLLSYNFKFGDSTTQYSITNPSGTTYRYTWNGSGTNPGISLSTLPIGTPLVIAGDNFNAVNNGNFITTGAGTNYFEIANASGVVESNKSLGTNGYIGSQKDAYGAHDTFGGYPGYEINVVDKTVNGKVSLNLIASPDYRVTGINIYRSPTGGPSYGNARLLATVSNTNQTYVDNIADASLGSTDTISRENTTNKLITVNAQGAMTLGASNTSFGQGAMASITVGGRNTVLGSGAASGLTDGGGNVLIGYSVAGGANPNYSVGIGQWALQLNNGGYYNIAIGHDALFLNSTGSSNVCVGALSGFNLLGSCNICIGESAGYGATGANNIFIGYCAGNHESGNYKLIMDCFSRADEATQRDSAILYGVMDSTAANQSLYANVGSFNLLGKIAKYNNIATEGYGVASIVDDVALTNQSADIGSTNFTNAGAAGMYRLNYVLEDTTADLTAGTITLTVSWTDGAGATTATANQILTGLGRASGVLYLELASGNVSYATSHTGIFGTSKYALHMSLERLR